MKGSLGAHRGQPGRRRFLTLLPYDEHEVRHGCASEKHKLWRKLDNWSILFLGRKTLGFSQLQFSCHESEVMDLSIQFWAAFSTSQGRHANATTQEGGWKQQRGAHSFKTRRKNLRVFILKKWYMFGMVLLPDFKSMQYITCLRTLRASHRKRLSYVTVKHAFNVSKVNQVQLLLLCVSVRQWTCLWPGLCRHRTTPALLTHFPALVFGHYSPDTH